MASAQGLDLLVGLERSGEVRPNYERFVVMWSERRLGKSPVPGAAARESEHDQSADARPSGQERRVEADGARAEPRERSRRCSDRQALQPQETALALLTVNGHGNTVATVRSTESIRLLVTAEEKALIERAAAVARRTLSDWLRIVAEERIERQSREEGSGHESTGSVPGAS